MKAWLRDLRTLLIPVKIRIRITDDLASMDPLLCDICLHDIKRDPVYKWDANAEDLFFCARHGQIAIRLARI